MKILIRNPQKKRLTENKQLLSEFTSADKQSVLDHGDRFTVSYEIELESQEGGDSGDGGSASYEEARLNLARNFFNSHGNNSSYDDTANYFSNDVGEREAEDMWNSFNVDFSDVDDLMTWFLDESSAGDDDQNYKYYMLIEAAVSRNPKEMKELVSFIADVTDPKTALNSKFHKFMAENCADLGSIQLETFEKMAKTLFRKHILNIDEDGNLLYPEVPCDIETLFEVMGEEDLFTELTDLGEVEWDGAAFHGYGSIYDLTSIGTAFHKGSPILKELVDLIKKTAETYIEENASEMLSDFQSNPIGYLDDIGYDWDTLNEEDYYDYDNNGDFESLLWEHLPNFMRKWHSSLKFEPDGSLDNGIEFSMDNPPFMTGLEEAFEFLEDFYEDYERQDNFEMNSSTGLHTNVGMLDAEGERKDNYNLVKALLYTNHKFATKGMGMSDRQFNRWVGDIKTKARAEIGDTVNKRVQGEKLEYPTLEPTELMNQLESDLTHAILGAARSNPKTTGFNIGYINTRGYVEFRYPGGEEATLENMKNATLYYAHIVKTALDPNYRRKDYIKKLIGFVNTIASEEVHKVQGLEEVKSLRKGAVLAKSYYSSGYDMMQYYRYLIPKEVRDTMELAHGSIRGVEHYFYNGIDAKERVARLSTVKLETGEVHSFTLPLEQLERALQAGTYRVLSRSAKGTRKDERLVKSIHDFLAMHTVDNAERKSYAEREADLQWTSEWMAIKTARKLVIQWKRYKDSPFPSAEPTEDDIKLAKSAYPEAEISGVQQQLRDSFKPFLDAANYRRPGQKKKEAQ